MTRVHAGSIVCAAVIAVLLHPGPRTQAQPQLPGHPQSQAQLQRRFPPALEDSFKTDLAASYTLDSFLQEPHRIIDQPTPPESLGLIMRRYEAVIRAYTQQGQPSVYVQWTVCIDSSGGDIYLKEYEIGETFSHPKPK